MGMELAPWTMNSATERPMPVLSSMPLRPPPVARKTPSRPGTGPRMGRLSAGEGAQAGGVADHLGGGEVWAEAAGAPEDVVAGVGGELRVEADALLGGARPHEAVPLGGDVHPQPGDVIGRVGLGDAEAEDLPLQRFNRHGHAQEVLEHPGPGP